MRVLYHHPFLPACRLVRLVLTEKKLDFTLEAVDPSRPSAAWLHHCPRGELPTLVDEEKRPFSGAYAIIEYLDEQFPLGAKMLGSDSLDRARLRGLVGWWRETFAFEVTYKLFGEKFLKRIMRSGSPSSAAIREGKERLPHYLQTIEAAMHQHRWLAGEHLTLVDFEAAAQFSVIDYLGDVPWDQFPEAKMWYMRLKSRPSFRPLLEDRYLGVPPAPHYSEIDF